MVCNRVAQGVVAALLGSALALSCSDVKMLQLKNNHIADFSPLLDNAGLGAGDSLQVQGQVPALDCSAESATFEALSARGVQLTSACP